MNRSIRARSFRSARCCIAGPSQDVTGSTLAEPQDRELL
ncbi:MAG: hypothetical protein OJF61_002311 [Rhodanobacteraceae bacterium]|nr:MAG: hypothetical protein OJF61_002311 [Rhodanobacteraceae bacterium]